MPTPCNRPARSATASDTYCSRDTRIARSASSLQNDARASGYHRATMATNPGLTIPAADYEGHMGEAGVDEAGPLRAIFEDVYRTVRPRRAAVLGCGPGGGLDVIDPACTDRLVGVDLNPE